MTWISPNFQNVDFPSGMSTDQEIEVFADRVKGWQLDIAQQCIDNIRHSGFAVLHIVASYFEMIAKFQDGFAKEGKSQEYFKKGVYSVFPALHNYPREVSDRLLNKLYEDVRCGLYHSGITGSDITINPNLDAAIGFSEDAQRVVINPQKLVPALQQHFQSYIRELRDSRKQDLRDKFEARFNYQLK